MGSRLADAVRFLLAGVETTTPVRAQTGELTSGKGGWVHLRRYPIKLKLLHRLGVSVSLPVVLQSDKDGFEGIQLGLGRTERILLKKSR